MKDRKRQLVLVLIDIRSAYNVGAMFRTADAVGVDEILLVGYTPAPLDRFGRERADVAKSALGAEKIVTWQQFATSNQCLKYLRKNNFYIYALEQDAKSASYIKVRLHTNTALIVGNETGGISKQVLQKVDRIIEIPMHGKKESLNVSVATGIALFALIESENR